MIRLSAQRDTPVALVFFPFAFSGICTGELCELRDNISVFQRNGVKLFGISCDATFSLRAFSQQEAYPFELLSDFWPHGLTARMFGVFDEMTGMAVRGSFLIDTHGKVAWSVINPVDQPRSLAGYTEALASV